MDAGLATIREAVLTSGYAVAAMLDGGADARDRELDALLDCVAGALAERDRLAAELAALKGDRDLGGAGLATAIAEALRRSATPAGEDAPGAGAGGR
jgi:uncharacterized protein YgbK (DUF1537 family)